MSRSVKYALFGYFFSVFVFVAALFTRAYYQVPEGSDPILPGAALGLLTLFLTERVRSTMLIDEHANRMAHQTKAISDIVASTIDFRLVGDPDQGLLYLTERADSLASVDNTYLRFIGSEYEDFRYDKDIYAKLSEKWKKHIEDNKEWRDIIGTKIIEKVYDAVFWAQNGSHNNYHVKTVDNNVPIINYMILEYKDSAKKEVLFGWAAQKGKRGSMLVFSSTYTAIVDYFSMNFEMMFSTAARPLTRDEINIAMETVRQKHKERGKGS